MAPQQLTSRAFLWIAPLAVMLILLAIWQLILSAGVIDSSLLPGPLDVFRALRELLTSGTLGIHLASSLLRVFAGYAVGAILAVISGTLLGYYPWFGFAMRFVIEVGRTISPIAWIPLAILWFGIGDTPAIFIIAITSFFPVLIATMNAPRHIDPLLLQVAENFGASNRQMLRMVILPASLPFIFVGLKVGLGIAWVVIVAAEMVGMRSGLGYLILDARNMLRIDMVIACMLVIGLVGFMLDAAMSLIERRFLRV